MKTAELGLFEECFTHIAEDGKQTTYASARLFKWCTEHPEQSKPWLQILPVEAHHAHFCFNERGVERHRLMRLLEHPDRLATPLLFVEMPDGSMLLLDGTHRYVTLFGLKKTETTAYFVPYAAAQPFIVEDAVETDPDVLRDSWSGM